MNLSTLTLPLPGVFKAVTYNSGRTVRGTSQDDGMALCCWLVPVKWWKGMFIPREIVKAKGEYGRYRECFGMSLL